MPGHVSTAGELAQPRGPRNVSSHAAPHGSSHRESGVCFEALAQDLLQANCAITVREQVFDGEVSVGRWMESLDFRQAPRGPWLTSPLTFSSSLDPKVTGCGLGILTSLPCEVKVLSLFWFSNCGLPSAVMCQYFCVALHFQTFNRKYHPGEFGPFLPNLISALFYLG